MSYAPPHGFACGYHGTTLDPVAPPARLALSGGRDITESDAAFAAGVALNHWMILFVLNRLGSAAGVIA
ncbi:hypothetical protein [Rhizobium herbae]|uniref:Uncharacterized protein n=1 Tax=Rhizobium herbae TaxID=508661 RepID=A0ABS4EUK5_9HYPH|nr:hypothetical protein [Rhizobium herbae]MBP1861629.1 hypothetical protein [Rhizobium herbae]